MPLIRRLACTASKPLPLQDRTAASVFVAVPGGGLRLVWIDPYSGAITGETAFFTFGRFVNLMHTTLFLPVIGRYVVKVFGVLMLVSIVTGLITCKKFRRGFAAPQERVDGRVVVNGQLGWRAENIEVIAYGEDLFNERFLEASDNDVFAIRGKGSAGSDRISWSGPDGQPQAVSPAPGNHPRAERHRSVLAHLTAS